MITRDLAKLLGGLEVGDLTSYLEAKGWRRRDFPREEVLLFAGPLDNEGEPIEVVFPASKQAGDFRVRVVDVLKTLTVLEDRDEQSIVYEMPQGPSLEGERDIEGVVAHLAASGGDAVDVDDEAFEGERMATLRFVDQGCRYHASIELESGAYRVACDAHRDGQRARVRGTLERAGWRWRIVGVKRFEVVSKEPASTADTVDS